MTSDQDLVKRFTGNGDEEAFRLLFDRHTPRLYAVAIRLMGGRAGDAEDVVQDAWLRASKRLAAFEWRSALSTWLIGITVNCAREALRGRLNADGDDGLDRIEARIPSNDVDVSLDLEHVLALLPARRRMVIVLHDVEGWTHAEIARALDMAEGTSKHDLFHARRTMRALLRKPGVTHD